VAHPGEPAISLGRWLEIKGLDHKHPKRGHASGRASPSGAAGPRPRAQAQGSAAADAASAALPPCGDRGGSPDEAVGAADEAARRLGLELASGRVDGVVQLTRVVSPSKQQQAHAAEAHAPTGLTAAPTVAHEPPALVVWGATAPAAAPASAGDTVAEAPTAPQRKRPMTGAAAARPPRLDVPGEAVFDAAGGAAGQGAEEGEGGEDDDSKWMQSPRKLRTPRGLPGAAVTTSARGAAAAAAGAGATAQAAGGEDGTPLAAAGAGPAPAAPGEAGEGEEEEEGIRIGAEFQAALPPWRPRPSLRCADPAEKAAAAAAIAADLARAGMQGPSEAHALLFVVQVGVGGGPQRTGGCGVVQVGC
jgi:hypothetical protein